jgi:RNase H-fold protein (predicted Holliday junction resolvase)
MALTKPIEEITPDEAIDTLRSLAFEYERTLFNNLDMSRETSEAATEDAHAALVVLQRYVDFHEIADGPEESLP